MIDLADTENNDEVFVGRKEEQNRLRETLKEVKEEGTKTIFIEGEAGIGKTSLVSKIIPFSEELGFNFLSGTCQSETSDPYLPFKEAFSEYIEGKSDHQKDSSSMAFMGAGEEHKAEDKEMFDAKKKETFYETTNNVREIAEEQPLVVFLDDLQWVDKATLDILSYMNEKLEETQILFIGTYRPEDVSEDHNLTEMMHRLERRNKFEKLELKLLSYENTRKIVEAVLGEEDIPKDFLKRLHDKTEGNPLFIKESIRQMIDDGVIDPEEDKYPERGDDISFSEMIQNVIERRVNRLEDETNKIIEMGSIIGGEISFDLLSKTAEMDEIEVLNHIDVLVENQLWEEDPNKDSFYFSHDLIEETVYDRIKGMKKKLLHKKMANNIEELYEGEIEDWYSDLARHHEKAENFDEAVDRYLDAGEKFEEMYATEDALEMYEKALGLAESAGELEKRNILEKISKCYTLLGRYDESREYLEKELDIVAEADEKQKVFRRIANSYYLQAEWEKCFEFIEKGLSVVDEETVESAELLDLKGWTHLQNNEKEEAERTFDRKEEIEEGLEGENEDEDENVFLFPKNFAEE